MLDFSCKSFVETLITFPKGRIFIGINRTTTTGEVCRQDASSSRRLVLSSLELAFVLCKTFLKASAHPFKRFTSWPFLKIYITLSLSLSLYAPIISEEFHA